MTSQRYQRLIVAFLLVTAAVIAAAMPAKAAQGTYTDAQLQLLFSGSKVEGNIHRECLENTDPSFVTSLDWEFEFNADGTLSIRYICEATYQPLDRSETGTWRVQNNELCVDSESDIFSRFIHEDMQCWPIRKGQFFFEGTAPDSSTYWFFKVNNPKYSSNKTLLAALENAGDQPLPQIVAVQPPVQPSVQASAAAPAPTTENALGLPPAEYKALPVGTKVTYDTWSTVVKRNEGLETVHLTRENNWRSLYGQFVNLGSYNVAIGRPAEQTTDLNEASRAAVQTLWPLKVGNNIKFTIDEEVSEGAYRWSRTWRVFIQVEGTEVLNLSGHQYSTYKITQRLQEKNHPQTVNYTATQWYNPDSGLVLKAVIDGEHDELSQDRGAYQLRSVKYPKGTTTHALTPLSHTQVIASAATQLEAEKKADEAARKPAAIPTQAPSKSATPDFQQKLATLKQVFDAGLLTETEYQTKKEALLQQFLGLSASAAPEGPAKQVNLGPLSGIEFGNYHALIIGNNEYQNLTNLRTAANDARSVAALLQDEYGFNVTLLLNAERDDIINALDSLTETLDATDNLLIYYAGHGWLDEEAGRGYWLPVDAKPNRRTRWLSNVTLSDTLRTLQAKHVMVVADSCFSGTLTRSDNVGIRSGDYWKRMAAKWTRVALVSGGLEPVADGADLHSPFAKAFIGALKSNDAVIDGTQLFNNVRRPVMIAANQTPQYSDVRQTGHDGGDFLFVKRR